VYSVAIITETVDEAFELGFEARGGGFIGGRHCDEFEKVVVL